MPTPQPGIFALGTRSHHHLEFEVHGDPSSLVSTIKRVREAATTVAGVNLVVGFGPRVWRAVAPDDFPEDFEEFESITGAGDFVVPGAQHDLWLWLHSAGPDSVFNIARRAAVELGPIARVVAEQPAFTYQASQDLTGFEDGTENPPLDEAPATIMIAEGKPCAGGSIVLLQRW